MSERFSLKDQLFNRPKVHYLSALLCGAEPGFDAPAFEARVMDRLPELELKQRIDWIATCLEEALPEDFVAAAQIIAASLPPPLDPGKTDDDFGDFIFAPFGEYVVRRGLEEHLDLSLGLLEQVTQRFSMEFAIRPFLNRWPDAVLGRMADWAHHPNYHVRRLASEGTRPKLPWGMKVTTEADVPIPLLDALHADPTRYVTRSVANHLNDLSKIAPDLVFQALDRWQKGGQQAPKELRWMTTHALRTLVKKGDARALDRLGFRADAPVQLTSLALGKDQLAIGDMLEFTAVLEADEKVPVLVDYLIWYHRPSGREAFKVFKLKQGVVTANAPLQLTKRYRLKGDATTFTLHPGPHRLSLQVNGRILGEVEFQLCE